MDALSSQILMLNLIIIILISIMFIERRITLYRCGNWRKAQPWTESAMYYNDSVNVCISRCLIPFMFIFAMKFIFVFPLCSLQCKNWQKYFRIRRPASTMMRFLLLFRKFAQLFHVNCIKQREQFSTSKYGTDMDCFLIIFLTLLLLKF